VIQVRFKPLSQQPYSAIVSIATDESATSTYQIMLTGKGVDGKFIAPAIVDFGDQKLGTARDTTITLQNTGAAVMNITGYSLADPSSGFNLTDSTPHQIAPQGSANISLHFNAAIEQAYAATLTITTDESGSASHQIHLAGRAVNSNIILDETQMDFGNIDTGLTSQKTFTIENKGTLSALVDSLEIRGGTMFTIIQNPFPTSISPGERINVTISFSPHQVGSLQAELWMKTGGKWAVAETLTGNGIAKKETSVRMNALLLNLLEVTPNPVSNYAVLKLGVTGRLEHVQINFYDAAGRLSQTQVVGSLQEGVQNIPLLLPQNSGITFLRIISAGNFIGTAEILIVR